MQGTTQQVVALRKLQAMTITEFPGIDKSNGLIHTLYVMAHWAATKISGDSLAADKLR